MSETDFDGRMTRYTRDVLGRVSETVRPDGARLTYTYDRTGLVTGIAVFGPDGRRQDRVAYAYDRRGLLVEARDEATRVEYIRDRDGRIVEEDVGGRRAGTMPAAGVWRGGSFPGSTSPMKSGSASTSPATPTIRWAPCRCAAGESIMAIARAIPLAPAPATVRRYASMDRPPEHGERRIGSSQLDPWLAYLERRRAEGCENGLQLLRELREHGYAGGSRQVHKWLQSRWTKVAITTPRRWRDAIPGMTAPGSADLPARREQLPGSKVLAWIVTVASDRLSPADSALLARIVQDPDAATLHGLIQRFVAFVREAGELIVRTWRSTPGGVRGLDRRGEGERHPSRADVRQRARR